jgi:hypothetical protein
MTITVMSKSQGLRNVLDILAEYAHNDSETDSFESNIILQRGLPKSAVQIYLNELESRRLAEEVRPRPSGEDFRLWRIRKQVLEAIKDQHLE